MSSQLQPPRSSGSTDLSRPSAVGVLAAGLFWRTVGVATTLLLALSHACLMLARLRRHDSTAVTALTRFAVGFSTAAAVVVSGLFAVASGRIDPAIWRGLGVLVVLALLTTVLAPLLRRFSPARTSAAGPSP